MESNSIIKVLLLVFAVLYTLSPVDLMIGPIDDLIIWVLYFIINKRKQCIE